LSLHPAVVRTAIRLSARRVRRLASLEQHILPACDVIRIGAAYSVGYALAGTAFWFALLAVSGDTPPFLLAVAVYNIAGAAGMLAIAVPSGVGVREGVTVALLAAVVPAPVALSAAVVARLTGVVADLAPLAVIVTVGALYRLVRARPSETETAV
jgi:uncharacterized membrane protein YbhN (UPF0104 family)